MRESLLFNIINIYDYTSEITLHKFGDIYLYVIGVDFLDLFNII